MKPKRQYDFHGREVGLWIVLRKMGVLRTGKKSTKSQWMCRCKGCGVERVILAESLARGCSLGCRGCRKGRTPPKLDLEAASLRDSGWTLREIAQKMGISITQARRRCNRGKGIPQRPMPTCSSCVVKKGYKKCLDKRLCYTCYRDYLDKCEPRKVTPVYKGKMCRHCEARKACRARGLCWTCSLDKNVRSLYPTGNKFGIWAEGENLVRHEDDVIGRMLPAHPTHHKPGTADKIEIMRQRDERGELLHHPLDAMYEKDWGPKAQKAENARRRYLSYLGALQIQRSLRRLNEDPLPERHDHGEGEEKDLPEDSERVR